MSSATPNRRQLARALARIRARFYPPRIARIASDHVDAAIRALTRANVNATEIHRRLLAGDAGLPEPLEHSAIAKRTVQHKAARFREEFRREGDPLEGDRDPVETLDAIMLDSLRVTVAEIERIKERHAKGKIRDDDAKTLSAWARTATDLRNHLKRIRDTDRPASSHLSKARSHRGTKAKPASTLDVIAAQLEVQAASEPLVNGDKALPDHALSR